MILLIDNYDSFTFNLQRYLVRLGESVTVIRNDDVRLATALGGNTLTTHPTWIDLPGNPQAIVLSPGPKRPCDAGLCLELVRRLSGVLPILGVCLGHQVICEAFGGQIVRAQQPIHGRATPIELEHSRLFDGLSSNSENTNSENTNSENTNSENTNSEMLGDPEKTTVDFARYHSLVAAPDSLPACLRVTAWCQAKQIMAVEHRSHATYGIQFHPESILSLQGYRLLRNFLCIAGRPVDRQLPCSDLVDEDQLKTWNLHASIAVGNLAEYAVAHPMEIGGGASFRVKQK